MLLLVGSGRVLLWSVPLFGPHFWDRPFVTHTRSGVFLAYARVGQYCGCSALCFDKRLLLVHCRQSRALSGTGHDESRSDGLECLCLHHIVRDVGALADRYQEHGVFYILTLLIVIWVADIAAYFVGRAVGRHKLAPSISPGKTREGAMAGIAGVVIWLLVSAQWPESFGADLMRRWGLFGSIVLAILLAIFSISGDLFESLLKRRAGVKDSSQLLPGHGGVFDRIDAVVAVVPLAYLLTGDGNFESRTHHHSRLYGIDWSQYP